MHVVAVQPRQQAVLWTHHAEDFRSVGVLVDLHDVALVGHLRRAVHAPCLGLQLVDAVLLEHHLVLDGAAVGQRLGALLAVGLQVAPHLVLVPLVGALAAEAQPQALQAVAVAVEVRHGGCHAAVEYLVFIVQYGVVHGQVHGRRRRHEVYAQLHWVAPGGNVLLRPQHQLDVLVVGDALAALRHHEGLLDGLAGVELDESAVLAVAQYVAVDGQHRAVGVRAVLHLQHVGADVVRLALVRQLQGEQRLAARRHVGNLGGPHHVQLGFLHAHSGLVELRAGVIELRHAAVLVWIGSLAAAGAEDGPPLV